MTKHTDIATAVMVAEALLERPRDPRFTPVEHVADYLGISVAEATKAIMIAFREGAFDFEPGTVPWLH
jgi:hypothetical protein